jgi:hypothetical protein
MKRRSALLALLGIFALVVGCGDPQAINDFTIARVMNALAGIPNNANADFVSSRSVQAAQNVAYGGITPYVQGPYGAANLTVRTAGTQTVLAGPTSISPTPLKNNTIVVSGVVGGQGAMAPRLFDITDTLPANSGGGQTTVVRLVNLSPDSGAIDLYYRVPSTDPNVPDPPLARLIGLTNITYGRASDYVIVPTGTNGEVDIQIYDSVTGTLIPAPKLVQPYFSVTGKAYTFFAVGLRHPEAGQQGFDAMISLDN